MVSAEEYFYDESKTEIDEGPIKSAYRTLCRDIFDCDAQATVFEYTTIEEVEVLE